MEEMEVITDSLGERENQQAALVEESCKQQVLQEKSENRLKCGYWAKEHDTKECTQKEGKNRCVLYQAANKRSDHVTGDRKKCTKYEQEVKRLIEATRY